MPGQDCTDLPGLRQGLMQFHAGASRIGEEGGYTLTLQSGDKDFTTLHGVAKFAGECLLAQVAAQMGFPLVTFRPCKIYGPGDRSFEYGPGGFLYSVLMGKPVRLYGDGSELRDHLFIEDLVQIVRHFAQNDESGIYNLASGVSRTYQDILSIIRKVINKEFEIIHEARTRLQVDQTVDISHLKQAVPELNLTSLEQGICKTFRDMEQRLSREALY